VDFCTKIGFNYCLSTMSENKLVSEIWVSDNLANVIFTDEEMNDLMDSCLENGVPSLKMKKGFDFMKRKLRTPRTKSEIKSATPEQLEEWLE